MHFHIITCKNWKYSIANAVFDEYTECLTKYVALSNQLFSGIIKNPDDLSYENALLATGHGDGSGAFVGTDSLAMLFVACEEGCEWYDRTWN